MVVDIVVLMDVLKIDCVVFGGYDWGVCMVDIIVVLWL